MDNFTQTNFEDLSYNTLTVNNFLKIMERGDLAEEIENSDLKNEKISLGNGIIEINIDNNGQFILNEKSAQLLDLGNKEINLNKINNLYDFEYNLDKLLKNRNLKAFNENSQSIQAANNKSERISNNIYRNKEQALEKPNNIEIEQLKQLENVYKNYEANFKGAEYVLDNLYERDNLVTPEEKLSGVLKLISSLGDNIRVDFYETANKLNLSQDFWNKVQEAFKSRPIDIKNIDTTFIKDFFNKVGKQFEDINFRSTLITKGNAAGKFADNRY